MLVEIEVRDLLSKYGFPGDSVPVVVRSALKSLGGDSRCYRRKSIDKLMRKLCEYVRVPPRPVDLSFLLPIEDVFSIFWCGTIIIGRIENGEIKAGDEVEIIGLRATQRG